jgi:hypothetical protein
MRHTAGNLVMNPHMMGGLSLTATDILEHPSSRSTARIKPFRRSSTRAGRNRPQHSESMRWTILGSTEIAMNATTAMMMSTHRQKVT